MNINVFRLTVAIITASLLLTANASDTTINITGKVTAAACTTGVGSTYNIDLGQEISAATPCRRAASTYVTKDIVLSDCPAGTTSVTATFDGTKDSGSDTMYANATGEGYATNVAVELQNKTAGTDVGKGATMTVDVDASKNATFPLQARAYSKSGDYSRKYQHHGVDELYL
jgi:type 1 fimbria pilin